jgi:hypothetical protein
LKTALAEAEATAIQQQAQEELEAIAQKAAHRDAVSFDDLELQVDLMNEAFARQDLELNSKKIDVSDAIGKFENTGKPGADPYPEDCMIEADKIVPLIKLGGFNAKCIWKYIMDDVIPACARGLPTASPTSPPTTLDGLPSPFSPFMDADEIARFPYNKWGIYGMVAANRFSGKVASVVGASNDEYVKTLAGKPISREYTSGVDFSCPWWLVEPEPGVFDFDKCKRWIIGAAHYNKNVFIRPFVAQQAPPWMSDFVNMVTVKPKESSSDGHYIDYPDYKDPAYLAMWTRYQQGLHDWIKNLGSDLRKRVAAVQILAGTTGDVNPYHGKYFDDVSETLSARDTWWRAFWVQSAEIMSDMYEDFRVNMDGPVLVFNGIKKYWPVYHEVMADVGKPFYALKEGHASHQYQSNFEMDAYEEWGKLAWTPFQKDPNTFSEDYVRLRGETAFDRASGQRHFWDNTGWNFMSLMGWTLTYGYDVINPNQKLFDEAVLFPAFRFFRYYAGRKRAGLSPGAWIMFHDALDYSDLERFPIETYGGRVTTYKGFPVAELDDVDRMRAIVAAHAQYGAAVDDEFNAMVKESNSAMQSRMRIGMNDAGYRLYTDNYQMHMKQVSKEESVSRFRIGDPVNDLVGRCARGFENASGKNRIGMKLDETLKRVMNMRHKLYFRVVFFNSGAGSWELNFDGQDVAAITHTNTGTDKWMEVRGSFREAAEIPVMRGGLAGGADVELVSLGGGDVNFAVFEFTKVPFVFEIVPGGSDYQVVVGDPIDGPELTAYVLEVN